MNRARYLAIPGIFFLFLFACSPQAAAPAEFPEVDQGSSPYPLAEPGPYAVGTRTMTAVDAGRENRPVGITVWYPAEPSAGAGGRPAADAVPDTRGKPYPLLLSSTKVAKIFAPFLVSRGFTWASVDGIDSYLMMSGQMIDQPHDILFALGQVTANPPKGLEGLIDGKHAGAIGYSFDGYNTLAMSGARIDPGYYRAQCPTPDETTRVILGSMSAFSCVPAREWEEFAARAGEALTASADGLWQPMTDERIRAVMPMAGEGWWLFGEKGLAAVDRPTLIIVATEDELYPENALIFEHLGATDKRLISFIGQDHMMIYDQDSVARMAHFAAAFFGFHLKGREDLARFFAEDFVNRHDDLAWGIISGD